MWCFKVQVEVLVGPLDLEGFFARKKNEGERRSENAAGKKEGWDTRKVGEKNRKDERGQTQAYEVKRFNVPPT